MIKLMLNLAGALIHGSGQTQTVKHATLKSAWAAVRVMDNQLVWVPSTSQKMSTYTFRALQNKLLACDLLMSIGVLSDNLCALCSVMEESRHLLFFNQCAMCSVMEPVQPKTRDVPRWAW